MANDDSLGYFVQIRRHRATHLVYLHTYEPATGRHVERALVGGFPCDAADDCAARVAIRVAAQKAVRDCLRTCHGELQAATVRGALCHVLRPAAQTPANR
ncbi:MAG: hypothetical protein H7Y38_15455 [Armatimonadetes bacterium]|nr:hypothetical protein [Armatimonadota bacterium]